ncbi:hypothetical protein QBC38DRAFT_540511 [Podospora fimiseda]|uniref:NACHT domain-containing protein n=1 Tax=Podospora fimiseda TaxID=252190 RepID=A0AAN7BE15_9PEZI|nr:hypothetical protein QBC38DRAFT_540511 [Podospora fimiseda]
MALYSPDHYTIGWIAALSIERAAATALLDERHGKPQGFSQHRSDTNSYTWGRMGEHNIVIASLPSGVYGTTSAATTACSLISSLPQIRIGLLVGIGGAIPRPDEGIDIRLGDVVVSQPEGATGGVVQYDLVKAMSGNKHERKDFLNSPPRVLLHALGNLQAEHELGECMMNEFLRKMLQDKPHMATADPGYIHQGFEHDQLFEASYDHAGGRDCRGCDANQKVQRDARNSTDPKIHYGIIASGNTLVKDAAKRDEVAKQVGEKCLCIEMEAAGLMNHYPCLVIRGICDYADSHKNDRWQRYASATAAAYAKELLAYVPATEVQETKSAREVLQLVQQKIDSMQQTTVAMKAATDSVTSDLHTIKIKRWLCPPDPSTNAKHARDLHHEGTGAWLLKNRVFQEWHSGSRRHLWLNGLAGCGKTILSATVLDHLAKRDNGLILSFFFDFSDTTKQTLDGMLRSLAFQLFQDGPGSANLLDDSFKVHRDGRDQPATKALEDVVCKVLVAQQKVCIVLDALDESTTRGQLLVWMKNVAELDGVQLLCTGRPESEFLRDIPSLIGKENCLELNKKSVNDDIRSYVAAQLLQRHDFQSLSKDLLGEIKTKVGDGADGILAKCPHEAAIEKELKSLPSNLGETYQRMIEGIPAKLKKDAIRLLQFLVHSRQPLRLAEAKEVIATQVEDERPGFDVKRRLFRETDVLKYCPSLMTVVHTTDKELHLAHFSVKEYLLGRNEFKVVTASISITRTCLTYLADIKGSSQEIKRDFPLARYAAKVWAGNAASAQASEDIVPAIVSFLESEVTFQRWTRLHQADRYWVDDPGPPQGSRLYYACFAGLIAPVRDLIGKGANVNAQGGYYGNPLQAASSGGHQEIVKLLLDKGADVNAQGGRYGNALQGASYEGHQEIVKLLLDKGADVNAQGGRYGNALYMASSGGHQEIVKLLRLLRQRSLYGLIWRPSRDR